VEEIARRLGGADMSWDSLSTYGVLPADVATVNGPALFPRIDMEKELAALEAMNKPVQEEVKEEEPAVEKPEGIAQIGIEDFMKVELRVAKIIACEKVPKAKKLLKLQVDLGYEQRQIVSGIAKYYEPEALIGKKIVLVSNLAPAKLCGIESQGMILASGEENVRVVFLADDTPLGERVR
jgi:methionyl-tRNA synthetase